MQNHAALRPRYWHSVATGNPPYNAAEPLTPAQQELASQPRHLAIVRITAARYKHAADLDDLESAAMLALIYVARTYDPTRGRLFTSCLIDACRQACWGVIDRNAKQRARTEVVPDDRYTSRHNAVKEIDDRDEVEVLIAREPNEKTRDVVRRRLAGDTFETIAKAQGVSIQRVMERMNVFIKRRATEVA